MAGLLQKTPLMGKDSPWLSGIRKRGWDSFVKQGIPTAKTEAWKYTKPRDLAAEDFVVSKISMSEASKIDLPFDCYYIRFENGWFCPSQSNLPQGVEVVPLIEVALLKPHLQKYFCSLAQVDGNPFVALNQAYLQEGVFIKIENNINLQKPLAIINHTTTESANIFFNLRNIIVVDKDSSATIVEYHTYSGEAKSRYLANIVNEIYLASGAELNHYKVQSEAFKANHISFSVASLKKDSSYNSFCLQKGANIGRNETLVKMHEEGAKTEVNSAYLMNGWATLDTTTNIEHLAPCTSSHQLIKGVIGGEAKGVFQGKIHIAPHAIKTEGNQLHKALLLTDTAEVDVKPELEIFADDVKCSHGATSGELDAEQLFYMRSRGIGLSEARQILIDAYLDEVITKISNEKIKDWIKLFAQEKSK
ncbi:MAG: Fe-S cluster assembly protein SufD [Alphaproteobacteria bacterium]|nr:Fe-S cluster assembly protein SufD [Alphaproteobacteria bacterium]